MKTREMSGKISQLSIDYKISCQQDLVWLEDFSRLVGIAESSVIRHSAPTRKDGLNPIAHSSPHAR